MIRRSILFLSLLCFSFVFVDYSYADDFYYFYSVSGTYPSTPSNVFTSVPTWNGSSWNWPSYEYYTGGYKKAIIYVVSCSADTGYSIISSTGYVNFSIGLSLPGGQYPSEGFVSYFQNNGCPASDCSLKAGETAGYYLFNYSKSSGPDTTNYCFNGCLVTPSVVDEFPCINEGSFCTASMQLLYTGAECTDEGTIEPDDEPASGCKDEWLAILNKCGGAEYVGSFDWKTCTGECVADLCTEAWLQLVESCGGASNIVSWDNETCSGKCEIYPSPNAITSDDAPPKKVETTTTTNSDGTKTVQQTATYDIDGDTTTTTTTTTYNTDGTVNNTTTTINQAPSEEEEEEETFSSISTEGFGTAYTGDGTQFDIPTRFNSFLSSVKSSSLFSFSTDFFDSLPGGGSSVYQIDGGTTFGGVHTIDLSDTMSVGLAVLKAVLLALFGFLSVRAIIMKR